MDRLSKARLSNDVHDGEHWVPWIGLALVVPAVIVLLVGVFGMMSGGNWNLSGNVSPGGGSQTVSIIGGGLAFVFSFAALMVGLVGLVRGLRRPAPRNGRSVGLAGLTLEIGIVVISVIALALLGFTVL
ncbi:MAG: hypothetical protein ACJ73D_07895 [Pyrinomonadaceae bacterium]